MQVHGERRSKRHLGPDRKIEVFGSREPNAPAIRPPIKLRGASNSKRGCGGRGNLSGAAKCGSRTFGAQGLETYLAKGG
jgi:hypothetical protein